jgi:ABC-type Zn uptake system ZnuABC Zn-binding protein ZnuA
MVKYVLAGLLVFLGAAAGCGIPAAAPEKDPDGKTVVVATIFPLADIARNIGGERAEVITLLPAGTSPHTFEPTPRQMEQVSGADVIVQVGAGLDDWVEKLTGLVDNDAVRVKVTDGMVLRQTVHRCAGETQTGYEHLHVHGKQRQVREHDPEPGHGHGHEYGDPHVWLDPVLVRDEITPRICQALCTAAPADAAYFAANLESFQAELTVLHEELAARVERFENRHFVTYHSAWGYFADRYGLVEVATVEEAPGKEPSPGWIATVVELARAHGAGAIFAEPQFSTKAAEVIANEYGGRVLILDPLGGESVPGRDSYLRLMRYNVNILEEGLRR